MLVAVELVDVIHVIGEAAAEEDLGVVGILEPDHVVVIGRIVRFLRVVAGVVAPPEGPQALVGGQRLVRGPLLRCGEAGGLIVRVAAVPGAVHVDGGVDVQQRDLVMDGLLIARLVFRLALRRLLCLTGLREVEVGLIEGLELRCARLRLVHAVGRVGLLHLHELPEDRNHFGGVVRADGVALAGQLAEAGVLLDLVGDVKQVVQIVVAQVRDVVRAAGGGGGAGIVQDQGHQILGDRGHGGVDLLLLQLDQLPVGGEALVVDDGELHARLVEGRLLLAAQARPLAHVQVREIQAVVQVVRLAVEGLQSWVVGVGEALPQDLARLGPAGVLVGEGQDRVGVAVLLLQLVVEGGELLADPALVRVAELLPCGVIGRGVRLRAVVALSGVLVDNVARPAERDAGFHQARWRRGGGSLGAESQRRQQGQAENQSKEKGKGAVEVLHRRPPLKNVTITP